MLISFVIFVTAYVTLQWVTYLTFRNLLSHSTSLQKPKFVMFILLISSPLIHTVFTPYMK